MFHGIHDRLLTQLTETPNGYHAHHADRRPLTERTARIFPTLQRDGLLSVNHDSFLWLQSMTPLWSLCNWWIMKNHGNGQHLPPASVSDMMEGLTQPPKSLTPAHSIPSSHSLLKATLGSAISAWYMWLFQYTMPTAHLCTYTLMGGTVDVTFS